MKKRSLPEGGPTLKETVPPLGGDEAEAIAGFRAVVERFRDHRGPLHPSPIFGSVDDETWRQLQLLHCAHHLSFLVPKAKEGEAEEATSSTA